jgi:adenosine deaminase
MVDLPEGVRVPGTVLGREGIHPGDEAFAAALERAWRLPKVELHLHLEGSLRPQSVCEMAPQYDPQSPFCRPEWWQGYWTYTDLTGFVTQFGQVLRACLQAPEDYERVARECFEDLAAQHVVYAEVSIGPRIPGRPFYLPMDEMVAAVDRARRSVETATGGAFTAGMIVGLARNHLVTYEHGAEALAAQIVQESVALRDAGAAIVGIDLHGDEAGFPDVGPYIAAFRLAAEAGLGLRAHAGEATGPQTVWESVRRLETARIAHGVRSVEDAQLVAHLAASGLPLDVCPTSNVLTSAAPSLREHQIRALHAAGVPLTVSSDDPLVFDTSVTTEVAILHHLLAFSWADLVQMQLTAAQHAFQPAAVRVALAERVRMAASDSPA